MKQHFPVQLSALLALLLFIVGCGDSRIGTGVVLWPAEELDAEHGEVVPVLEQNRTTNAYLVRTDDSDRVTVDQFRIELFESQDAAEEFAAEYREFAHTYARSLQRALPVRQNPTTSSRAVYRLREDEIIKILGPPGEEESISGLQGRWHPVLTEQGVRGYAFDFSLALFDIREGIEAAVRERELPQIARDIIESVWRPFEYADMVSEETPALERINPEHGLFPQPASNKVHVRSDGLDHTFEYTGIATSGSSHVRFESTTLEVRIDGSRQITAFFTIDGNSYTRRFRRISGNLDEILDREHTRRKNALEAFHADGQTLVSSAYGNISIGETGSFLWSGYEELVPFVIAPSYRNTGRIAFNRYLGSALRGRYDGVVSFRFDGAPQDEYVHFVYEREADGIRLSHIPRSAIDDLVVRTSSGTSVVMFFRFTESSDDESEQDT